MRREWWLDLALQYGDPCDFVSRRPHENASATNIHVREVLPDDVTLTHAEVLALIGLIESGAEKKAVMLLEGKMRGEG